MKRIYFIKTKGEEFGPLTIDQLEKFVDDQESFIWFYGEEDWKKFTESFVYNQIIETNKTLSKNFKNYIIVQYLFGIAIVLFSILICLPYNKSSIPFIKNNITNYSSFLMYYLGAILILTIYLFLANNKKNKRSWKSLSFILVALLLSIVIIVPTLLNFLKNGFYVKNIENNITEISKVDNLNWFQYSIYRNGEIINIQNQKLPTTKFKQIKFYEEINNPLFIINDRFVVDKSNKLKIGNRNENINFISTEFFKIGSPPFSVVDKNNQNIFPAVLKDVFYFNGYFITMREPVEYSWKSEGTFNIYDKKGSIVFTENYHNIRVVEARNLVFLSRILKNGITITDIIDFDKKIRYKFSTMKDAEKFTNGEKSNFNSLEYF